MEYFGAAVYHAERHELDYAVFYAGLSGHPNTAALIDICRREQAACEDLKIKACEYGIKKWYNHAAKKFAAALELNAQDETARRGLIYTAGKGFIL